jgi:PAS domain S-box-containing protein
MRSLRESPGAERRGAFAAAVLLVAIVAIDLASDPTILISLLVVVPLVAALVCSPRTVALFGVLTFTTAIVMGAVDELFFAERHIVGLVVVAIGSLVGFGAARSRVALAELRTTEGAAYRRIALLDRSSRLIAAPMDFEARLRELARLVVPDVADLAMIDLCTPDGRLDGVVASAKDPAMAELVERTRAASPIDPASEHPVAVTLRTGEPQRRAAMQDEELQRYASSPEHLATMRKLAYSSAIVVPLIARGSTLGVLSVLRLGNPVPFGETDTSLMSDLASRAALAVDNARLFEERAAAESQLQAIIANLAEAVTIINAAGDLVYINEAAADLFGYASAAEALTVPVAQMTELYELLDEDGGPLDRTRLPGTRALAGEDPRPVTFKRRHRETGEERWLTVKASAVPDVTTGRPALAVNVIEDITAERRARESAAFLSEASKLLASSMDFEATLAAVAHAAVPQIADWCAVDLIDDSGIVSHVALAHVEPDKEAAAAELRERYPADPEAPRGSAQVRRTGQSELHTEIEPALLEAAAVDERHLELLRALDMTSGLIVPLTTGERTIGTITFVTTGGRRRLAESDLELAEELGRRAGVAVENARVHRERSRIAATLQRSLLPPRLPVVPGITLAARFRAAGEANQVGGDFYDLFPVPDGWMVVIGDVTGKGPAAAAITSLARYTIRTAALYEPDPAAVMGRLNEVLLADADSPQMCTAACLRITPAAGERPARVELVCAGHPPPYLLRAGGALEELCRPGPLLGAFGRAAWEPSLFELRQRDAIVLYTDGVTDARGADGRFGQERLEEVLREATGGEADAIAERLDAALLAFQEGPQRDDVAVLVLQATGSAEAPETTVVADSSTVRT